MTKHWILFYAGFCLKIYCKYAMKRVICISIINAMMRKPFFSIVIPTYNRAKLLNAAIAIMSITENMISQSKRILNPPLI